jgi:hypothetical protein
MKIHLPNDKLGFYKVNDKKFYGKLDAVLYANTTKSDISWNFNKEIFNTVNWKEEPETDLLDFYKWRATQIREEYDYIILMCSGGADSTNMLYSFLKNGIHVDEVLFAAPMSGLSNWEWDNNNLDANNTISEARFAQMPLANEIRVNWPNVKITINDYFEDILDLQTDKWLEDCSYWAHPSACRFSLEKFPHIKNLADSGKRIAKIFALDKPLIVRTPDGNLFNGIFDNVCQVGIHKSTKEEHTNLETVYFYYAPEMPLMIVKQAHVLAKWLYMPENYQARKLMADLRGGTKWISNEIRYSLHHRSNIKAVYPMLETEGWNPFQAYKSFSNFTHVAFDNWFYKLHGSSKTSQLIESDFKNLIKHVDKKYFNENNDGLIMFSQQYHLGHETKFISNALAHTPVASTNFDPTNIIL